VGIAITEKKLAAEASSFEESPKFIINSKRQGGTTSKQALGYETMEESDYLAMAPSSRCEGCTR
jgi:hypothetical protein